MQPRTRRSRRWLGAELVAFVLVPLSLAVLTAGAPAGERGAAAVSPDLLRPIGIALPPPATAAAQRSGEPDGSGGPPGRSAAAVPAGASSSAWPIDTTANALLPTATLAADSCSGAACVAVGAYDDGAGTSVPLVESAVGAAWRIVPATSPVGTTYAYLDGVSCPGVRACQAVGASTGADGRSVPLAESFDGHTWSIRPTPVPPGATYAALSAVSCTAENTCEAVGAYTDTAGASVPLTERWDGRAWTAGTAPAPAGAGYAFLDGVSCPAGGGACSAVGGFSRPGGVEHPLAEHSSGGPWSIEGVPDTGDSAGSFLAGVSCRATGCEAVGTSHNSAGIQVALAEERSAGRWVVSATEDPTGATTSALSAVSCATPGACAAVGYSYAAAGVERPLVETGDGRSWQVVVSPAPPGATSSELAGVACQASGGCRAVGTVYDRSGVEGAVALRSSGGSWGLAPAADAQGAATTFLGAVSCGGPESCVAVGYRVAHRGAAAVDVPAVEEWDGRTWRLEAVAAPAGAASSELDGVSCAAPGDCMAVGYQTDGLGAEAPLAERSTGAAWAVLPTADLGGGEGALYGVSCPAPAACTAVGSRRTAAGAQHTLVERWTGSGWAAQPAAEPPGAASSALYGVACSGLRSCAAVGSASVDSSTAGSTTADSSTADSSTADSSTADSTTAGGSTQLTEGWDGLAWRLDPSTATSGSARGATGRGAGAPVVLDAVACSRPDACTAVGQTVSSGTGVAVAERWDGAAWRPVVVPDPPGARGTTLFGVACRAVASCTAVGVSYSASGIAGAVVEAFDGRVWSLVPASRPAGATYSALYGVSCAPAGACRAAGASINRSNTIVTLVESERR